MRYAIAPPADMAPKTRLESVASPSLARDQYMETQVIAKKEW